MVAYTLVLDSWKIRMSLVIVRRVVALKETCTCFVFGMSVHYDSLAVDMSIVYPFQTPCTPP